MVPVIQTIGAVVLGVALVAVAAVGLVSSINRRKQGRRTDPDDGGDYPTNEGPTPGYWD
jgi:hypothetical protein